ncbi:hypothetical protein [Gilliamella apis]|uniref:hypothetical protein n=1 Tax=Gilliamella apis TaxID=1970738 RepID=UPI0011B1EB66|nr:hypothetical protein [Gilliamella apis]
MLVLLDEHLLQLQQLLTLHIVFSWSSKLGFFSFFNAAFASFKSLPATSPTLGINPTNAMA